MSEHKSVGQKKQDAGNLGPKRGQVLEVTMHDVVIESESCSQSSVAVHTAPGCRGHPARSRSSSSAGRCINRDSGEGAGARHGTGR